MLAAQENLSYSSAKMYTAEVEFVKGYLQGGRSF